MGTIYKFTVIRDGVEVATVQDTTPFGAAIMARTIDNVSQTLEETRRAFASMVPDHGELTNTLMNQTAITKYDDNWYEDPESRGLTIEESAARAQAKVTRILSREEEITEDDYACVGTATLKAISQGMDRVGLYRLAGRISRERREEGMYMGVRLANVFNEHVEKILTL